VLGSDQTASHKGLIRGKHVKTIKDITIKKVTSSFTQQVEDHVTRVFLETEPLFSTFPKCKTGGRERDFRKAAKQSLSCGLSVMALNESKVIAKSNCTGLASAAVHKKAGMEEIDKLDYDNYRINGKVVFRDVPTRGSYITIFACRLKDSPPYVMPLGLAFNVK
ncbi:hypothetical protein C0J52_21082, partial [Blattella germanica]